MKNPNGFGTVYKLGGNRTRPYVVKKTENKRQYSLGYFETYSEALQFLLKYNDSPEKCYKELVRFKDIYVRWKRQKYSSLSQSSINSYENAYSHCKGLWNQKMCTIRYKDLQNVVDNVDGYATQRKVKVFINQVFNYAIKFDLIDKNYSEFITLKKHIPQFPKIPYSTKEIDVLWQNISIPIVKDILILVYTGMRIGEYMSLTTDDINLDIGYIDIKKSKTLSGIRKIPINHKIFPFIKEKMDNRIIFNYPSYDVFRRSYTKCLKNLGMNHTIHECRHTLATLLDNADANDTSIKMILGHARQGVTKSIYTHKDITELKKTIELI